METLVHRITYETKGAPSRSEKRHVLDCTYHMGIFKEGISKGLPGGFSHVLNDGLDAHVLNC